ncbi:hypothetical protein QJS66_22715 [Kocuria rhizophila]|nr:hypothetical protein QJS66_22715 [Kocuria rhizophila]
MTAEPQDRGGRARRDRAAGAAQVRESSPGAAHGRQGKEIGMRWDELFQDMESAAGAGPDEPGGAGGRGHGAPELARLSSLERLAAHRESTVRLRLAHGRRSRAELVDARRGLGRGARNATSSTGAAALRGVVGRAAATGRGAPWKRSTAPPARHGSRARGPAPLACTFGLALRERGGQSDLEGTVDAVGQDFFDLAVHPEDQFRRRAAVTGVRTVPSRPWRWSCQRTLG